MPWANFGQLLMGYDSVLASSTGLERGGCGGWPATEKWGENCHLIWPYVVEPMWQLRSRPVTAAGQRLRRMPHGKPEREFFMIPSHRRIHSRGWHRSPCLPATQIRLTIFLQHAFVSQLSWMADPLFLASFSFLVTHSVLTFYCQYSCSFFFSIALPSF